MVTEMETEKKHDKMGSIIAKYGKIIKQVLKTSQIFQLHQIAQGRLFH